MSHDDFRAERERIARCMSRGEPNDPIDSLNFRRCLSELFREDWEELADAFHSGNEAELGRLFMRHATRHAYREATCG